MAQSGRYKSRRMGANISQFPPHSLPGNTKKRNVHLGLERLTRKERKKSKRVACLWPGRKDVRKLWTPNQKKQAGGQKHFLLCSVPEISVEKFSRAQQQKNWFQPKSINPTDARSFSCSWYFRHYWDNDARIMLFMPAWMNNKFIFWSPLNISNAWWRVSKRSPRLEKDVSHPKKKSPVNEKKSFDQKL